jgi:hypothetical protein
MQNEGTGMGEEILEESHYWGSDSYHYKGDLVKSTYGVYIHGKSPEDAIEAIKNAVEKSCLQDCILRLIIDDDKPHLHLEGWRPMQEHDFRQRDRLREQKAKDIARRREAAEEKDRLLYEKLKAKYEDVSQT